MDIDFEYLYIFPSVKRIIEEEDFLRNCYMTDISKNEIVLTRNYLCKIKVKIKVNKRLKLSQAAMVCLSAIQSTDIEKPI